MESFATTTKIYNKRTTVPQEVREALNLGEKDMVLWYNEGKRVIVQKVEKPKKENKGFWPPN